MNNIDELLTKVLYRAYGYKPLSKAQKNRNERDKLRYRKRKLEMMSLIEVILEEPLALDSIIEKLAEKYSKVDRDSLKVMVRFSLNKLEEDGKVELNNNLFYKKKGC